MVRIVNGPRRKPEHSQVFIIDRGKNCSNCKLFVEKDIQSEYDIYLNYKHIWFKFCKQIIVVQYRTIY